MNHGLTRDERRARARVVCAGVALGLAVIGVALFLAHRTWHGAGLGAGTAPRLDTATEIPAGVTTLDEAEIYAVRSGHRGGDPDELDTVDVALHDATPAIPDGAMFDSEATGANASALHADAIVPHGVLSASREREEAAAASKARRALDRGARAGAGLRAAPADDYNEMMVRRASFRSCWEADASASGKVSLEIVVNPAHGVSVSRVAASGAPDGVVSCVAAKARSLPFRVPSNGGPRTFAVSSSYSRQIM